jgi:hypothetical protein
VTPLVHSCPFEEEGTAAFDKYLFDGRPARISHAA